jgi:hypothetical protein
MMKTAHIPAFAIIAVFVFSLRFAEAQDVIVPKTMPPALRTEVVRLRLHPSPATQPALEHRLLPDLTEQAPGDAATLYLIAAEIMPSETGRHHVARDVSDLEDLSIDQLRGRSADLQRALDALARRCGTWSWPPTGERSIGIGAAGSSGITGACLT